MEEEGGEMGMKHMSKGWMMSGEMERIWEKLDDETKKQVKLRVVGGLIMKTECKIKLMQYKLESLQMIKQRLEK